MKSQVGENEKRWIIINCLSGLSTRIVLKFIQRIEIEADVIRICVDKDWTVIRRYNRDTIEARLRETEKSWKDIHFMNDRYFGEGTEARQVKEDQENERRYLESLGGLYMGAKDWEMVCKKALSTEMSWLRDGDFRHLKRDLESLSDKFAINLAKKIRPSPTAVDALTTVPNAYRKELIILTPFHTDGTPVPALAPCWYKALVPSPFPGEFPKEYRFRSPFSLRKELEEIEMKFSLDHRLMDLPIMFCVKRKGTKNSWRGKIDHIITEQSDDDRKKNY